MNELNGPSEEAIEWVNQIRRRANATEIKLVDFNKDTFRDFILDERGRELYWGRDIGGMFNSDMENI